MFTLNAMIAVLFEPQQEQAQELIVGMAITMMAMQTLARLAVTHLYIQTIATQRAI
jgi:hypothetical protein